MPRTAVVDGLETDLQALDAEIAKFDASTAAKDEAAEAMVASMREEGKNPLLDKDAFEKVDAAYKEADTDREAAADLRRRRETVMERLGKHAPRGRSEAGRRQHVLGVVERFMESDGFKRLAENGAFEKAGTRIEIPGVEIAAVEDVIRALKSGNGIFAATADIEDFVPVDQRLFPPVDIPVRTVRVTQMVTVASTESDQVDFVRETTRTDAAAETAPGTAAPEATYAYEADSAPVRDIVHFTPAHKRNLADAGETRALLEGRLSSGVERRLERQIIQGDGTGQNLEGILETSGIGSVTFGSAGHASENELDAIHRGITTVRIALEDEPDAIGIHPSLDEIIVLAKDEQGRYIQGDVANRTADTLWGFPKAVTTAFPDDRVLVGNYKQGAVLWLRSGVALSASDSHEDFFTRRMVALMAELRAAFAAWQPRAFCEVVIEES